MSYIVRREWSYSFNIQLPRALYPKASFIRMALGLSERRPSIFLASVLAQKLHAHLDDNGPVPIPDLRALLRTWRDEEIASGRYRRSETSWNAVAQIQQPRISKLAAKYFDEGQRNNLWVLNGSKEIKRSLAQLVELTRDVHINELTRDIAAKVKDALIDYPFKYTPEAYKGKTALDVISEGGDYRRIDPITVNNKLRKMTAFVNWCVAHGHLQRNHFDGLKALAPPPKSARESFEPFDLTVLLTEENLRAAARGYTWRYWLPLMARFTGARLEELSQLQKDDIFEQNGIWCMRFDERGTGQRLKNQGSRRTIPIHPELLSYGLLDHWMAIKESGGERLFPDLVESQGKLGTHASKWFLKYRHKLGITSDKKTFHSFRHTFIDDLRDSGVQDSLIKRLVGHEDGAVTFKHYGSRSPIRAMLNAISHITLTGKKTVDRSTE
ncbi:MULTISPECIES: site-specific integrase [Pseudomonas]|uniref:Site-specific integrase n=1 Tax=Pseudomonas quercus TaxID=2722792 RepID=A0ABX0Y9P0_9PSED|nr:MULTISPECIES: site-specific integrase [Pseudomonas]MBF7141428.1 site-specific integrase [Pseudomonas sp. LY10J]NJO99966.1 site-specific integrase [Pseudomonas quercus]